MRKLLPHVEVLEDYQGFLLVKDTTPGMFYTKLFSILNRSHEVLAESQDEDVVRKAWDTAVKGGHK